MPRPGRWDDAKIVSVRPGRDRDYPCWIATIKGTDCTRIIYISMDEHPDEMGAYAAALKILIDVAATAAAPTKDIEP
jgi:hypothetical protein